MVVFVREGAMGLRICSFVFMLFSLFFVFGCASGSSSGRRVEGFNIAKRYDEFKKMTVFSGPFRSNGQCSALVRAWVLDGSGDASYQIYVDDEYRGEWRFYNHAFDIDGNSLDFTVVDRKVKWCIRGECTYGEKFAVNVSRKYLLDRLERGVRFKAEGRRGALECTLSPGYIKAVLSTVPGG